MLVVLLVVLFVVLVVSGLWIWNLSEDNKSLRIVVESLVERVAAQSELLSRRAEKQDEVKNVTS